jgi:hypothetical protein
MKLQWNWRFAIASAVAAVFGFGAAQAQDACRELSRSELLFGPAIRSACPLAPSVEGEEDYGWISVRFAPPSIAPIIPKGAAASKWLRLAGNDQARRAFAIGEVTITDGTLGPVVAANVPLAEFTFGRPNARGDTPIAPVAVTESVNEADRFVTPRFRIGPDTVIRVRVKLLYTNKDRSDVLRAIDPYISLAKDFGAQGGVMNALTSPTLRTAVSTIEQSLNGLRQGSYESDVTVDLRFAEASANQLNYQFTVGAPPALGKQGATSASVNLGALQFKLDRQPSAFNGVKKLLADSAPDFGLANEPGTPQFTRFLNMRVGKKGASGQMQSLNEYILAQAPEAKTMGDAQTTPAAFEAAAGKVLDALTASDLALSSHDQFAAYYLMLMKSRALQRKELQATATVQHDMAQFARYKFFVPAGK